MRTKNKLTNESEISQSCYPVLDHVVPCFAAEDEFDDEFKDVERDVEDEAV